MSGQIPNTKYQIPDKFQIPNSNDFHLESGIWNLVFEATEGSDLWLA
jgi:hypothetical protein